MTDTFFRECYETDATLLTLPEGKRNQNTPNKNKPLRPFVYFNIENERN